MNTNDTKKRNASRGEGGGGDDDDDYCYGEYAYIGSVKILFEFVFV